MGVLRPNLQTSSLRDGPSWNSTIRSKHATTMSGESKYVTLVSSDDFRFVVRRSSAYRSDAIKRMLDPTCS